MSDTGIYGHSCWTDFCLFIFIVWPLGILYCRYWAYARFYPRSRLAKIMFPVSPLLFSCPFLKDGVGKNPKITEYHPEFEEYYDFWFTLSTGSIMIPFWPILPVITWGIVIFSWIIYVGWKGWKIIKESFLGNRKTQRLIHYAKQLLSPVSKILRKIWLLSE